MKNYKSKRQIVTNANETICCFFQHNISISYAISMIQWQFDFSLVIKLRSLYAVGTLFSSCILYTFTPISIIVFHWPTTIYSIFLLLVPTQNFKSLLEFKEPTKKSVRISKNHLNSWKIHLLSYNRKYWNNFIASDLLLKYHFECSFKCLSHKFWWIFTINIMFT